MVVSVGTAASAIATAILLLFSRSDNHRVALQRQDALRRPSTANPYDFHQNTRATNGLPALSSQILVRLALTLNDVTIHQNSRVIDQLAGHLNRSLQNSQDGR